MPRGPRRDGQDEIHHVFVRGLERRIVFTDDRDRSDLVERLSTVLPESGSRCLAWALLPNHFHLLLKRGSVSLSRTMARINGGYATRFNRRHGRAGFLFQNRFGSRIVDDDAELVAVARYVVSNPLKHGVCKDEKALRRYPWGSLSGLHGHRSPHPFESLSATRGLLEGHGAGPPRGVHLPPAPVPGKPPDLEGLVRLVCARLDVDSVELGTAKRTGGLPDARAAICWLAISHLGLSGADLARQLKMTRSGVSRALERGRSICVGLGLSRP